MSKVPTLQELQADPAEAFRADQFNFLMNQEPPANWVASHPLVKVKNELGQMVPMKYLPIDKVEYLMTRIFKKWYVEILTVQALFNAVVVTVRVHYHFTYGIDPEWKHTDGVGASGVQTDKDAKASDLASIKLAAVQMAAPSAESYAIKDACEKLGKIFGRDLSRKNTINYESFDPPQQPATQPPQAQPQPYNYQPLPMTEFKNYRDNLFPDEPQPTGQPMTMDFSQQPPITNQNTIKL